MTTKVRKSKKPSSRVAAAKVSKDTTKTSKTTSTNQTPFKRRHIASIVIYLLLAVAALTLMKSTTYQLTIGYLAKDTLLIAKTDSTVLGPAAHAVWDIQIRYALAGIMLLSTIVPILYLTKLKQSYQKSLTSRVSLWRWIDLGIIMGMIIEIVALLSGLSDIPTLKVVGLLILITCLLGWLAEKQVSGNKVPAVYSFSLVTGSLPWLIIIPYAVATIMYGALVAPWYTYALYLTTFLAAGGLAMVQYRQHLQRGKFKDYSFAEQRYLSIGMFAKVAFAVVLILGLMK